MNKDEKRTVFLRIVAAMCLIPSPFLVTGGGTWLHTALGALLMIGGITMFALSGKKKKS
jgi:hypothetical protein